jgi:hypothetical protein
MVPQIVATVLGDTGQLSAPTARRPLGLRGALGLAGRRTGALPRPLTTAALVSAGVDALAPVVLAVPRAALVVPAGRFPTFIVLGISGVRLAQGAGAG